MNSGNAGALRRRVLLSGTMLVAVAVGYGRRAYGACVNSGGSTFQCSGANITQQTITANNASVSTVAGFSVNTAAGNAITITGDGALSYTDTNASPLTAAAGNALYVRSGANYAATPGPGSVTIDTNGRLSGSNSGILARNNGTGALTITANGDVTGTKYGIFARNVTGTDLSVTTGPGTTVSGHYGIVARNDGGGALTITANGNFTGTTFAGIYARNVNGTALSVTTAAGTTVSGYRGIGAYNSGSGALTIVANGDVTGTSGDGIDAQNGSGLHPAGTALNVTTAAGTTVSGGRNGIFAANFGTGALTITANSDVAGTTFTGIYARNSGTALSVTTAAGTTVSSGFRGINAVNSGTGALTITANGDVTGTAGTGITASNSVNGTALSVTTGPGTTVSGRTGIDARNSGRGALTITAYGNVYGTSAKGIYARNTGAALTVTTAAGTVRGATTGIDARNSGTGALTIAANGNVTGTTGYGIDARNLSAASTTLSVTTAAGTVRGATTGIHAGNSGTGALTITANGDVTGTSGGGIFAQSGGGALAITVAATGTVTSNGASTNAFAIETNGAAATVTVAGTVNGGAGGAIKFDQTGAFANRLELVTGAVINGNVLGGTGTDTLALTGTGTGSFDAGLIGPGRQYRNFEAFQKTGSGTWTLTGTNTLMLPWTVAQGTLIVNGSLSNAAFTMSGGTLGGTGTVGNTLITGGTFAPGSGTPGSFMTVNGTLGFSAASTYAVNLNPTTSSFANVSGTATLGGATVDAVFANGSYISKRYTILTAGSVSGSFGTLTNINLPPNFIDALSYDATHAYLNLTPDFGRGLSGNQNNVANALINFFNTTGGIPAAFGSLIANGLSQVSGESATGSQQTTFDAMNQFMGVLTDPFIDGRGDSPGGGTSTATGYASTQKPAAIRDAYAMFTKAPPAFIPFEQRWSVWAAGYGGSQTSDGNAAQGSSTATSRLAGTAVGADYRISPFTIAGFALAGGGTSFAVNGMGSGRSDLFQAGGFVRHTVGQAYVTAALAYGWQDVTTDRTVTIAGVDRLRAQFNANAFSGRAEGGYRFVSPWIGGLGITPYAAGQFTTFELPNYAEQVVSGANTFALAYGAKSVTAPRSEIGVRTDKSWAMQNAILTLRGRVAWAYDTNTTPSIGATFQALPGASFVVNGAAQSHNKALTTASAEVNWLNGWSAAATFEGEFSDVTRSYAGKGVVRYQW